jgi:hypothetical protein
MVLYREIICRWSLSTGFSLCTVSASFSVYPNELETVTKEVATLMVFICCIGFSLCRTWISSHYSIGCSCINVEVSGEIGAWLELSPLSALHKKWEVSKGNVRTTVKY